MWDVDLVRCLHECLDDILTKGIEGSMFVGTSLTSLRIFVASNLVVSLLFLKNCLVLSRTGE